MDMETGSPKTDRAVNTLLSRMTPGNAVWAQRYLKMRRVHGIKPGTLLNYAYLLLLWDKHRLGAPFLEASPDDVLDFLALERSRVGEASVVMRTRMLKRVVKDLHGSEQLPKGFAPVFKVREPRPASRSNILDRPTLERLLAACHDLRPFRWMARLEHAQALLLVLWDTGMRIGEVLSLHFQDVLLDEQGGILFRLDPRRPGLKRGARDVYVAECAGAVKAWMALHPDPRPESPLFISTRKSKGVRALEPQSADNLVKLLARSAGLAGKGAKALSCHDFRHSSATRRAKANWLEDDLRRFHGWEPDSMMPRRYAKRNLDDLRELVRRDAGLSPTGFVERHEVGSNPTAQLADLLRNILGQNPPQPR
jgi:integrase